MKKSFIKIKATYLFNFLAVVLLLILLGIYSIFEDTNKNIIKTNYDTNIKYVEEITSNIEQFIKDKMEGDKLYENLNENKFLIGFFEKNLQLFITEKYKYIYVVDKVCEENMNFRVLLDGTKDEENKSEFEEIFNPSDVDKWNNIYKTKKSTNIIHKRIESLWMTYLKPIIINEKIIAVIVVDFSIKEHENIINSFNSLNKIFEKVIAFFLFSFLIIVWFSYMDNKRAKEKEKVDLELEETYFEIYKLNQTLEKRVQEEVDKNREKDKQMFQQSKMAQMGEMLSMIAHQWRQPLSAINATAISINLKAHFNDLKAEKVIEQTDNIAKYSQHLSQTIDDFRNFFKSNKEIEIVNFNELVKDVLSIVQISIENKNIKIIENSSSSEKFETYPNELKQVILNLIKNAEDILLEKEIENPYIKIDIKKEQDKHILEVSDNGGGVDERIIKKIFHPYFSTKKEKDGTGLGLYMSKTIIEDHCKGTLTVSNSNDGAVFKITL